MANSSLRCHHPAVHGPSNAQPTPNNPGMVINFVVEIATRRIVEVFCQFRPFFLLMIARGLSFNLFFFIKFKDVPNPFLSIELLFLRFVRPYSAKMPDLRKLIDPFPPQNLFIFVLMAILYNYALLQKIVLFLGITLNRWVV